MAQGHAAQLQCGVGALPQPQRGLQAGGVCHLSLKKWQISPSLFGHLKNPPRLLCKHSVKQKVERLNLVLLK